MKLKSLLVAGSLFAAGAANAYTISALDSDTFSFSGVGDEIVDFSGLLQGTGFVQSLVVKTDGPGKLDDVKFDPTPFVMPNGDKIKFSEMVNGVVFSLNNTATDSTFAFIVNAKQSTVGWYGEMTFSGNLTPVPEPETYALMLAGLGALGFMARRRNMS